MNFDQTKNDFPKVMKLNTTDSATVADHYNNVAMIE